MFELSKVEVNWAQTSFLSAVALSIEYFALPEGKLLRELGTQAAKHQWSVLD